MAISNTASAHFHWDVHTVADENNEKSRPMTGALCSAGQSSPSLTSPGVSLGLLLIVPLGKSWLLLPLLCSLERRPMTMQRKWRDIE